MLQTFGKAAGRFRHFGGAPAINFGGSLTLCLGLVTHLRRIRFQPAGLQFVILEDLNGLCHRADLVAPVRSLDIDGQVTVRKRLHRADKTPYRRDKPVCGSRNIR